MTACCVEYSAVSCSSTTLSMNKRINAIELDGKYELIDKIDHGINI